jgi:hypothetical protein
VTVISLLALILACPSGGGGGTNNVEVKETPSADDFTITGTSAEGAGKGVYSTTDDILPVVITPKDGKTDGSILIKYNGTGTAPAKGTVGVYAVTFDVGGTAKWNPVGGLSAGFINVTSGQNQTPDNGNFTIVGLPQNIKQGDAPAAITITPKYGSPAPAISNQKVTANGGTATIAWPLTAAGIEAATPGLYNVTFNVAVATGWNAGIDIFAGTINVIKKDDPVNPNEPTKVTEIKQEHFNIFVKGELAGGAELGTFNVDYQNAPLPVTLDNKPVGGPEKPYPFGQLTPVIQYWQGDVMMGVPRAKGVYTVKIIIMSYVNIHDDEAWNPLEFSITLNVNTRTPAPGDYNITKLLQSEAGSFLTNTIEVEHVGIAAKTPANSDLDGAITIIYTSPSGTVITAAPNQQIRWSDSPTNTVPNPAYVPPPQTAGTYAVTFNVAASSSPDNWGPATGLVAGDLVVKPLLPVNPGYSIPFWFDEDVLKAPAAYWNNTTKRYEWVGAVSQLPISFGIQNGTIASTIVGWKEDGKDVEPNSDETYTFNKTAKGWHWVTLVVKTADTGSGATLVRGKLYSETVYIRVQ